jgi:hypothetical protein
VLHLLCFTISLVFALLALAVISLDMLSLGHVSSDLQIAVFFIALAVFWLPLSYVSCILLNVMDTVYYWCVSLTPRQHSLRL